MILFHFFDDIEQQFSPYLKRVFGAKFLFSEVVKWKYEKYHKTITNLLKSLLSWDSAHLKHQDPWSWIWNSLDFCSEDWFSQIFMISCLFWCVARFWLMNPKRSLTYILEILCAFVKILYGDVASESAICL